MAGVEQVELQILQVTLIGVSPAAGKIGIVC